MGDTAHCFFGLAWIALALWSVYAGVVFGRGAWFNLQASRHFKRMNEAWLQGDHIAVTTEQAMALNYADKADMVGLPWPIK